MTTAYIYETTGKIVGVRSGNHAGVVVDAEATGKSYILSDEVADMDTHYVSVTTEKLVKYPTKPSDSYVFDYAAGNWQFDLHLGKQLKWLEIKQNRNDAEFDSFSFNSKTFQCDAVSQARIQACVQAAMINSEFETTWTVSDNSTMTVDAERIKELGKALAEHVKACHDRGRIVRALIDAATTEAELEEIKW